MYANDRLGLLADVVKVLGDNKCNIMAVTSKTNRERIAVIELTIEVENTEKLNNVLKI